MASRHGCLRHGHRGGAGHRSHARRLDHRQLFLALDLLHQSSRRPAGAVHGQPLHLGPALSAPHAPRRHRCHRLRPDGPLAGLITVGARQGPGGRLVRGRMDLLGHCRFRSRLFWDLSRANCCTATRLCSCTLLLDRNFRMGTLITGLFGVLLYGVTAFMPLFLQTLLGYSAMDSGLAVSPRGLGSMLAMLMVGALMNRFDSRALLAGWAWPSSLSPRSC
jgi:hypothetical protein